MLLARWLILALLLIAVVSFALFAFTAQPHFKRFGLRLVQWTVLAGLLFFAVLILERVF